MKMDSNFYEGLNKEQLEILREQMNRFENLKTQERKKIDIEDKIILPEGTLIHGSPFVKDAISNISKTGIITGQYFGIPEDGETYYCADFHKVEKETTLEDYNSSFKYIDGRCPFGKKGSGTLAYIIYPDERLDEITSYDCYKEGTEESKQAQSFVNMNGLPLEDKSKASSILYGIPSCFINGIVLSDNMISKENVEFLIQQYPNTFIVRNNGSLLYKVGDSKEVWNLRVDAIVQTVLYEKEQEKVKTEKNANQNKDNQINNLWAAISTLPVSEIAKVYEAMGWQGDYTKYAERLKEQYEISIQKK